MLSNGSAIRVIKNNAHVEAMECVYTNWKKFAKDASIKLRLGKEDLDRYASNKEAEMTRQWIRFLTVLVDDAQDFDPIYAFAETQGHLGKKKNNGGLMLSWMTLASTLGFHAVACFHPLTQLELPIKP